jgi:hypothetical protein
MSWRRRINGRKSKARKTTGRSPRRDSPVARLSNSRRMNRSSSYRTDRAWAHLDRMRLRRALRTPAARVAIVVTAALAFLLGRLASGQIVRLYQGDVASPSPSLIHKISVQGSEFLSAGEIAAAAGVVKGSPTSSIDTDAVESRLIEHPWILRADSLTLPTGNLLIRIEERYPLALLYSESIDRSAIDRGANARASRSPRLIDTSGTPFVGAETGAWPGLPRLHSDVHFDTGQPSPVLLEAIVLAKSVDELGIATAQPRTIELPSQDSDEGWVLRTDAGRQRVILGHRELGPRIERLAMLLGADLGSARVAEEIDLRFADRAVMRSASPSR